VDPDTQAIATRMIEDKIRATYAEPIARRLAVTRLDRAVIELPRGNDPFVLCRREARRRKLKNSACASTS